MTQLGLCLKSQNSFFGFYGYRGAVGGYYGDQSHYTHLGRLSIISTSHVKIKREQIQKYCQCRQVFDFKRGNLFELLSLS
jgi:hypothetical protein